MSPARHGSSAVGPERPALEPNRAFLPWLRALDRDVNGSKLRRARILTEVESDLESYTRERMEGGTAPETARREALALLLPNGAVIAALGDLHASAWARLTRGVPQSRLRRLERWFLIGTAMVVLAGQVALLRQVDLLRHGSDFLWPMTGLGALLGVAIVATAVHLWLKEDDEVGARYARAVAGVVVAIVAVGAFGGLVDLHLLAGLLEQAPDRATELALVGVVRVGVLGAVTLSLALAGGIAWLVAHQRIATITSRYRRSIGEAGTHIIHERTES